MRRLAIAAAPMAGVVVFLVVFSGYSPPPVVLDALASSGEYAPSAFAQQAIPAAVLPIYQAAARTCPGMDWAVLAGIGKIETNHGRSTLPGVHSGQNFAGAMGPMQFLQGTWDANKVAAPGHIIPNIYDIADAIYSAAKYLCSNGGGAGLPTPDAKKLHDAIWHYNHSEQYVSDVLAQAQRYRGAWLAASTAPTVAGIQPGNPLGPDCPHPPITQGFGPVTFAVEPAAHGFQHFHTGWDLACPFGTLVREIGADGLTTLHQDPGWGNSVDVEVHTATVVYFVRYAHLDAFAPGLRSGALVHVGDLLGYEGSTGKSTGPHLHFEVDQGSTSVQDSVNPASWLAL